MSSGDKPGAEVREPLLPVPASAGQGEAEDAQRGLVAAEAKRLVGLAGPIVASCVLQSVVNMVSVMVVGHLGELPLAGASLATSLANVTGYSLLTGMATALDTLCGQAFGARQYHLLGVYKQRAMVVLGLACVPIALIWARAGEILVFLGQDADIAAEAGAYARWLIPSLLVYVPLQCHVRFLQTQSVVLPVTATSCVTALCHLAVCWALVYKAGMGSRGAALSNAVSYAINLVMLALYVRMSSACKGTWNGFSKDGLLELRRFTKLAVPSAMMICLEWWSFEILVLLSGLLPNPQLETSVLSICLNTGALLYMIPLGLTSSISTRVSNELGAGKPQAAKLATRVVMYMALSEGLVISLTMTLLRNVWGYMYSNEPELVAYIAKMLPILGISFFIDGLHTSLSGIPMAVLLAFVFHLNGMGLWLGIVCGSFTKLLFLVLISWFIDWEKEAGKAKDRVFSSSLPVA
ncbi:hypothetical protein EJB05_46569 [Eragrostis curvula]|uniref:Protein DETOXIFICATION n=1 Tax=Eragrostis curvula TaxID=38414 RepID=A0A5J9TND4_9POAL|nr:hypothetical protein EJB05_46569 [Eragrostis curvula]